jgi:anaerobic sulfite reductase subunit C
MAENDPGFTLEMPKVGVIRGVRAKDIELVGGKVVNLRTCARPYGNIYSVAQLRAIDKVSKKYGSGKVHLSPRHNLEIPEIKNKHLDDTLRELYVAGLFPGGAGTSVRNVFTCPDWCSESLRPTQEIGKMISTNFGDQDMPNKFTISFAGCPNGCSRPHNSDVGIIGVGKVAISDQSCPEGCQECSAVCPLQAVGPTGAKVQINRETCNSCGKCVKACPENILKLEATGFRVLIGGKEGATVAFGSTIADFVSDFELLEIIENVLRKYQEKAALRPASQKKMERLAEVIERLGLNSFLTD